MHYYRDSRPQLLTEGLNVEDILTDILQVGIDSGAIVITGGAAGDTVADVMFAAKEAAEIIGFLKDAFSELQELGRIIKGLLIYDLSGGGLESYFEEIQGAVIGVVKNGLVGQKAVQWLEDLREAVQTLINKVVRAVSKWVGALIPDDFGLGGPAFEATVTEALENAASNSYEYACKGIRMLPERAQELLLDEAKLEEFLREIVREMTKYVDELGNKMANPDEEKAGYLSNMWANAKLTAELGTAPLTGMVNIASNLTGHDDVFDSVADDIMDNLETLPSWHPTRKVLAWGLPKVEDFLIDVEENHCDMAAAALGMLMKVLLGALGVLQIAMDEEFVDSLKDIDPKKLDIFDYKFDIDLTPKDLLPEVASKPNIHKWKLNQLLIEGRV